jgi:hypothetical protein
MTTESKPCTSAEAIADLAKFSPVVWTLAKGMPIFRIPGTVTMPIPEKHGMVSTGSLLKRRSTRSLGVSWVMEFSLPAA